MRCFNGSGSHQWAVEERGLSSSRNKKAEGLEHMVVSGLGRAEVRV